MTAQPEVVDLITPEALAVRYGRSRDFVMRRARTSWPHVRVGRRVLFTPEQVRQIDALMTVTPDPAAAHADSWGRRRRSP